MLSQGRDRRIDVGFALFVIVSVLVPQAAMAEPVARPDICPSVLAKAAISETEATTRGLRERVSEWYHRSRDRISAMMKTPQPRPIAWNIDVFLRPRSYRGFAFIHVETHVIKTLRDKVGLSKDLVQEALFKFKEIVFAVSARERAKQNSDVNTKVTVYAGYSDYKTLRMAIENGTVTEEKVQQFLALAGREFEAWIYQRIPDLPERLEKLRARLGYENFPEPSKWYQGSLRRDPNVAAFFSRFGPDKQWEDVRRLLVEIRDLYDELERKPYFKAPGFSVKMMEANDGVHSALSPAVNAILRNAATVAEIQGSIRALFKIEIAEKDVQDLTRFYHLTQFFDRPIIDDQFLNADEETFSEDNTELKIRSSAVVMSWDLAAIGAHHATSTQSYVVSAIRNASEDDLGGWYASFFQLLTENPDVVNARDYKGIRKLLDQHNGTVGLNFAEFGDRDIETLLYFFDKFQASKQGRDWSPDPNMRFRAIWLRLMEHLQESYDLGKQLNGKNGPDGKPMFLPSSQERFDKLRADGKEIAYQLELMLSPTSSARKTREALTAEYRFSGDDLEMWYESLPNSAAFRWLLSEPNYELSKARSGFVATHDRKGNPYTRDEIGIMKAFAESVSKHLYKNLQLAIGDFNAQCRMAVLISQGPKGPVLKLYFNISETGKSGAELIKLLKHWTLDKKGLQSLVQRFDPEHKILGDDIQIDEYFFGDPISNMPSATFQ